MSKKYEAFKKGKKALNGKKDLNSYFPVHLYMVKSDAFLAVSGNAFKLFIDITMRFNGYNNGEISYSIREAQDKFGWSPNTVCKYFKELQDLGFLKCSRKGRFDQKRHASLWEITHWPLPHELNKKEGKKTYMSFKLAS